MEQAVKSNTASVIVQMSADEFFSLRKYSAANGYGYDLESALRDLIRAFLNNEVGTNPARRNPFVRVGTNPEREL